MKCEFKLILCLHTETCHRDQKGRVSTDLLEMTKANCKHCIVREEKLKPFLTTPTSNQGLLGAGSHGVRILGRKGEMLTSKQGVESGCWAWNSFIKAAADCRAQLG